MKCDELEQVENPIEWGLYYDMFEVDAVLAKKDKEIAELKQEIERLKQENEMAFVGINLRSPASDGRFV